MLKFAWKEEEVIKGMSPEKTSETKQDSNLGERIFGDHHHTTTIREGTKEAKGEARTPEEAEKRASEQWEKQYGGIDFNLIKLTL